jgi:hypothetical protein
MAAVVNPCCAPLTSNVVSTVAGPGCQVARRRRALVLAPAVGLVSK